MKKQIAFYIGWDIVFIGQMYIYSKLNIMLRSIAKRSMELNGSLWFQVGWLIIVGGLISILAYKGSKYQVDKKSAALELAIIGIPATYMSMSIAIPYSLATLLEGNLSFRIPFWIVSSTTPMMIGSILLGYEIFVFLTRIVKTPNIEMDSAQARTKDTPDNF